MIHKKDYYGYIYEWTNSVNNMKYIGSHYGSVDDSYIGSGKDFMVAYYENPNNFTMQVLEYVLVNDKAAVLVTEKKWLDMVENIKDDSRYYNRNNDAVGGFGYITVEHIAVRASTLRSKHKKNGLSDAEKHSYHQKIATRLGRIRNSGFTEGEKNQHAKYGFEIIVTDQDGKKLNFSSIRKANKYFGLSIGYGLSAFIKYSSQLGLTTQVVQKPIIECNKDRKK